MTTHLQRWRLILGRYADPSLGEVLDRRERRMDRALERLYGQEMERRGLRRAQPKGPGSLDPSRLTPLRWLGEARSLFPASVFETLQRHAVERYGMHELLRDPRVVEGLAPDPALLKAMLGLPGAPDPALQQAIRALAAKVVEDLLRRLRHSVAQAFSGAPNRFRRSRFRVARNFDWRATIRANLQHYDPQRRVLVPERLYFHSRLKRRLPWTVVLCVDQSGSMLDSLIHSVVLACVLARLPSVRLHLVLFDTAVVDASERVADPVDLLLSVQLGGGTDIGKALGYCEGLVDQPRRTLLVLLSDFCEGASVTALVRVVRRLAESGVTLLGLAALDDRSAPDYDREVAARLSAAGMAIAALTPDRFARWLAEVVQ